MPKRQLVEKDAIQFKIDSARQCQLGRRSRPPQSLPSSWHSHFYGSLYGFRSLRNFKFELSLAAVPPAHSRPPLRHSHQPSTASDLPSPTARQSPHSARLTLPLHKPAKTQRRRPAKYVNNSTSPPRRRRVSRSRGCRSQPPNPGRELHQ